MSKSVTFALTLLVLFVITFGAVTAGDKPGFEVKWYGYFKLDGAYDQNPTSNGNYVVYVPSKVIEGNDHQFNMTANETRFGFNATGVNYSNVKVDGKLEVDLYASLSNTTIAENKPMLQLRHAFFNVQWNRFQLVAGQSR